MGGGVRGGALCVKRKKPRPGQSDWWGAPGDIAKRPTEGGRVFVADTANHRIQIFSKSGAYLRTIGGNGAGTRLKELSRPYGVALAGGRVYVADQSNHRVLVFLPPPQRSPDGGGEK